MNMLISTSIQPNLMYNKLINNIRYIRQVICAITCCLLFSGCASFSDRPTKHHKIKLDEGNLSEISGTYQLYPDSVYDREGELRLRAYTSKDDRFHQYVSRNKISFDTLVNSSVTVRVSHDGYINFLFKENGIDKDAVRLSYKLQSRGLLILGNKYVKFEGIPYILGGSRSEKTRIGLAKDGGLILNHAVDNSGAFLLMIGTGYSYNASYHFKRIKSKSL